MGADDERGPATHRARKASKGVALVGLVEVGENKVAAEDEVERAIGRLGANIVAYHDDMAAKAGEKRKPIAIAKERRLTPGLGERAERRRGIASLIARGEASRARRRWRAPRAPLPARLARPRAPT